VDQLNPGLNRLHPELPQAHALVVILSTLLLHHLSQVSDVAALLEHALGLQDLSYSPTSYPSTDLVSHPPTNGVSHQFYGINPFFPNLVASICRLDSGGLSYFLRVL
jgi:hypothetical protein